MTWIGQLLRTAAVPALTVFLLSSCVKEKVEDVVNQRETYSLNTANSSGVSGSVAFKREGNGTRITITLKGADPQQHYPAGIYQNASLEAGPMAVSLGNISGSTGQLDTLIYKLDNGINASFDNLMAFNGHVSIQQGTFAVAAGDIGGNELTGQSKTYPLQAAGNSGVTGTFTIQERKNGHVLTTLRVTGTGTDPLNIYPAAVMNGKADDSTRQQKVVTLGNITPGEGILEKNIRQADNGTRINYTYLTGLNAHVNIWQTVSTQDSTLVAQGNIGPNVP